MTDVQISYNGKIIGVIFDVTEIHVSQLRKRVAAELKGEIPEEFIFLSDAEKISTNQESLIKIASVLNGDIVCICEARVTKSCCSKVSIIDLTSQGSTSSYDANGESRKKFLSAFKSPKQWQMKKIKLYDTTNPSLRPGERKRRLFLNKNVKVIAEKNPNYSREKVQSQANLEWQIEKVDGLRSSYGQLTEKLIGLIQKKHGSDFTIKIKKKTIENSLKRLKEAKRNVKEDGLKAKAQKTHKKTAAASYHEVELRKALDALRKLVRLRAGDLDELLEKLEEDDVEGEEYEEEIGNANCDIDTYDSGPSENQTEDMHQPIDEADVRLSEFENNLIEELMAKLAKKKKDI